MRTRQQRTPTEADFVRLRARYLVGVLFGYLAASAEVIVILHLLVGARVHAGAAAAIVTAGAVIGAGVMATTLTSALRWYRSGAAPTAGQRARAATLPVRHAGLVGVMWAVVGASVLTVHHAAGAGMLFLIGGCMVIAAAGASFMAYLLAERVLRPVFAVALAEGANPRLGRYGVWVRLLLTWALCTAIPLGGIAAIVLLARFGWPVHTSTAISVPVLILAAVGVVAGLRGMTVAARSIGDPLHEVTERMRLIGSGDYDVRTAVYDSSEIGVLQTGFNEMAAGIAERERVRDLFGRHVGREVAAHALDQHFAHPGRVCDVGVVFIDLAGSTTLAANHPPDFVADVLNAFFRVVVGVIDEHSGFINKFEGDAALAIFGAPRDLTDPAGKALAAARSLYDGLHMLDAMPDFGIGVTYGQVFAGNIGGEDRYEYTVIGDPVNAAARLSDLAKTRDSRVLATAAAVSHSDSAEAQHWRTGDEVVLRGRPEPTTLAEPVTGRM